MRSPLKWFNPQEAVRIYRGNLPHWRQTGCLYFITFRLADSVPRHVADKWQEERRLWMVAHGIDGYPARPDWKMHFDRLPETERKMFERMNTKRLFTELDQSHGECVLRELAAQQIVSNALLHFDGDRWDVGDFIVMPNHVHALVQPLSDHPLEETLYSVKRFAAREINKHLKRTGSIWQKEYYDHIVRNVDELNKIRKYIAENPAKANLSCSAVGCYRATWIDSATA